MREARNKDHEICKFAVIEEEDKKRKAKLNVTFPSQEAREARAEKRN